MKITIVGLPGTRSARTLVNAEEAVSGLDRYAQIEWISDIETMSKIGLMQTPTVFINENKKLAGRIPSVYEFQNWISAELQEECAA